MIRDPFGEHYYDGTHEASKKIREVLKDLKELGFTNEQAVMFAMGEMEIEVIRDRLNKRGENARAKRKAKD